MRVGDESVSIRRVVGRKTSSALEVAAFWNDLAALSGMIVVALPTSVIGLSGIMLVVFSLQL